MTDNAKTDPALALARLMKLGGAGTGGLAVLLIAGAVWLRGEVRAAVREEVQSVVQAELQSRLVPVVERIQRLEVEQEVSRRMTKESR